MLTCCWRNYFLISLYICRYLVFFSISFTANSWRSLLRGRRRRCLWFRIYMPDHNPAELPTFRLDFTDVRDFWHILNILCRWNAFFAVCNLLIPRPTFILKTYAQEFCFNIFWVVNERHCQAQMSHNLFQLVNTKRLKVNC